MSSRSLWKYLKKSTKYKLVYVYQHQQTKEKRYVAIKSSASNTFTEERDAAKRVDILKIREGKPPLNILK